MSCHVRLVEAWELQWRHLGVVIAIVLLVVVSREPWWCLRPLRLHVGGVLWRDCRLGRSRRCIRSGRTLLRAMLAPVGSEYRLLICDVIRVAPLLRSGMLGLRGPVRDPRATMWDVGYDVTRKETEEW